MTAQELFERARSVPAQNPEERRRNVVMAVVLALSTLLSIIFLVYAFQTKNKAEQEINLLRQQVEVLRNENNQLQNQIEKLQADMLILRTNKEE